MFRDFKKFILRGNLVDLAIGFTVGASFSTVAKSLVNDIIMPPISALLGDVQISDASILLRKTASGDISLRYGLFLNNVLSLLVVGVAMFFLIKIVQHLDDDLDQFLGKKKVSKEHEPELKKCPYCLSKIPYRATRCSECTSKLAEKTATKEQ